MRYQCDSCSDREYCAARGHDLKMNFCNAYKHTSTPWQQAVLPAALQDSGARREFSTGAVRDIAEGKGRADLLPLKVLAYLSDQYGELEHIDQYVRKGHVENLMCATVDFGRGVFGDLETALLEASKQFEAGAIKYNDRNWEKGLPLHCFIDSAVRHYLKFKRGDKDEPHDRAFLWNLLCAIWTHENRPEMIDLPFKEAKV